VLECKTGEGGVAAPGAAPAAGALDAERAVLCAACGHRVTSAAARSEVGGRHQHTAVNPHGFVFHFGCWSSAPGALGVSEPSPEWSWFPGHTWQIAVCAGCQAHLGWRFRGEHHFWGLIVDRLVDLSRQ
jgi:hypothetical protein